MEYELLKNIDINELLDEDSSEKLRKLQAAFNRVQDIRYALITSEDSTKLKMQKMGTTLTFAIIKMCGTEKTPSQLSEQEWETITNTAIDYTLFKDGREYTKYVFEQYAGYIMYSANGYRDFMTEENYLYVCSLARQLNDKTIQFNNGEIGEVNYTEDCLWISLEAMIKLMSATLTFAAGKIVPEEYAHLLDVMADYAFVYGRLMLYREEQAILTEYLENQHILDEELKARYEEFIAKVNEESERFLYLVNNAYSDDFKTALKGSIELARASGVRRRDNT